MQQKETLNIMKTPILDIARVVRSKNSGPFELTMDIIFRDRESYERVKAAQAVNKAVVARAYAVPESAIRNVIYFDPAGAVKITMDRPLTSGEPGETDVYGAQQHAPLLSLEFDLP